MKIVTTYSAEAWWVNSTLSNIHYSIPVDAMKRVEEIKNKRQAQHIYDRWKKAKEIEKQKDIREVQRDLALIRSPAAGLKRAAKDMEVDNEIGIDTELDTSIKLSAKKANADSAKSKKAKLRPRIIEEVQNSDHEMEEN